MSMVANTISRVAILLTGCIVGMGTLMPNIMLSDNGSTTAVVAANIGIIASCFFVLGGVIGCVVHNWLALLPGFILQLLAFAVAWLDLESLGQVFRKNSLAFA